LECFLCLGKFMSESFLFLCILEYIWPGCYLFMWVAISWWRHAANLAGYEQQDAHEFFISTVDGIHANSGTTSPRARHSQGGRYAHDKAVLLQSPFAH
jgi:hypothetical protein